jgi:hypothetical protein
VVVTARVQRQVAGLFVVEERGRHELKGMPEPVTLYRIVRASGAGRRAENGTSRRSSVATRRSPSCCDAGSGRGRATGTIIGPSLCDSDLILTSSSPLFRSRHRS